MIWFLSGNSDWLVRCDAMQCDLIQNFIFCIGIAGSFQSLSTPSSFFEMLLLSMYIMWICPIFLTFSTSLFLYQSERNINIDIIPALLIE